MKQELRLQQNNKGLSLVELIVTILISSVVMLAVVGLLTTGLDLYKNVNAETELQTESQAACGRINELVQEAQNIQLVNVGDSKVLALMTTEEGGASWWYYIIWDSVGKMLLLTKDSVTVYPNGTLSFYPDFNDINKKVESVLQETKKHMLAQYVEGFSFEDISKEDNLYKLKIILVKDGKRFTAKQFINIRSK